MFDFLVSQRVKCLTLHYYERSCGRIKTTNIISTTRIAILGVTHERKGGKTMPFFSARRFAGDTISIAEKNISKLITIVRIPSPIQSGIKQPVEKEH